MYCEEMYSRDVVHAARARQASDARFQQRERPALHGREPSHRLGAVAHVGALPGRRVHL